jgi:hypothetical protein
MWKLIVLYCAWAKQNGQKTVVTDGVQKLSPAQSFSDKSVKIKGNKNVKRVCP